MPLRNSETHTTAASASIRPLALGFSPKGRSRETIRRSWTAPAVAPRGSVCQHPKVALSQLVPARSMGTLITKKSSAAVSKRSPCIAGNTVARSDPIPPFYVVATTGRWPDSCLGPIPCNVARLLRFPIILGGGFCRLTHVSFRGKSRRDLLSTSIIARDATETLARGFCPAFCG